MFTIFSYTDSAARNEARYETKQNHVLGHKLQDTTRTTSALQWATEDGQHSVYCAKSCQIAVKK